MEDKVKTSKFLSLILRHKPEAIGITLNKNGWAKVDELLEKLKISKEELDEVVKTNDKQRFTFNDDETFIRASQGHSIEVDVELEGKEPPEVLYHGTSFSKEQLLMIDGIRKMKRLYVHLSDKYEKAIEVGRRHGAPVVFQILAKKMYKKGHKFFLSKNGVWLVDYVPREYLMIVK